MTRVLEDAGRLNDPTALTLATVTKGLAQRGTCVVQFSRPEAYTPTLLADIDAICAQVPDTLQVRFYGHYGTAFDAAILRHLPHVKNLSLDCLMRIENETTLGSLAHLRKLTFGVFEYDRPELLAGLDLSRLTALGVLETRKRNIDLAPLATASRLKSLHLIGQSRGIDAVGSLSGLETLHLGSLPAKQPLTALNALPALRHLVLVLGGRNTLDDLSSPTLETLQVLRVKGVTSLGDIRRFPALHGLRIEDQVQLDSLDLSGVTLDRLHLYNCKTLCRLDGLNSQSRLQSVFISRTALDMDALRDRAWPGTLQNIRLFTSRHKWNSATAARFAAMGIADQAFWLP